MAGIKELMEKMESDAAFRETIQSAKDKDELMSRIKAAGFDTTLEEFSKAAVAKSGELSDEELEGAAGGANPFFQRIFEEQKKERERERFGELLR